MRVELKTKRFFTCPNGCACEMVVEHLFSGSCAVTKEYPKRQAGPWYCDECGQGWILTYDGNSIDVRPRAGGDDARKRKHWVTLELAPQTVPVRFKVKGIRFEPTVNEEVVRYHYEEGTCPTNWLRDVAEVSIGDDDDPHGLWTVASIDDGAGRAEA